MRSRVQSIIQIQRSERPLSACRRAGLYLSPWHSQSTITPYQSKRVDNEQRYELLTTELEHSDNSLLDIGCAEALLTSKFAEDGLFCIGVEQREPHVKYARKNIRKDDDNIGIIKVRLTPENIGSIPQFDVSLLLSVYQHFVLTRTYSEEGSGYGVKKAEEMLKVIADKSNKIFFEIWEYTNKGKDHTHQILEDDFRVDRFSFDIEPIEDFWPSYFKSTLNDSICVNYLGKSDYKGGERQDMIFLIDCREYEIDI